MTRLFGTNGIRGVVGDTMTPALVLDVAKAVGTHFQGDRLALGTDTRTSGAMLKAAALAGLTAMGCDVVDLGTTPSPAIQLYVKTHPVAGGVIITASHNPREFNGIKVVDAEGMEAARAVEEAIERTYFDRTFAPASWNTAGTVQASGGCSAAYVRAVRERVDAARIREAGLTVAVDCANGAACYTTPYLLRDLGCEVLTLNAQPDGTFPGHPPEPREEHVTQLMGLVQDAEADLGVVHDGDADRVLFVDERGAFVHGDRSLALIAGYLIRGRGGGEVVTPVSSSQGVEDAVRQAGGSVVYTKVGAPVVARTMAERGAVFGGEENGGLIFPEHQYCRDGAMGVATLLDLLAAEARPLTALLEEIPTYFLVKGRIPVADELKAQALEAVRPAFAEKRVEELDGLKVHGDEGWVLIRPSGTEAVIRVFSEARKEEDAAHLHNWAMEALRKALDELA